MFLAPADRREVDAAYARLQAIAARAPTDMDRRWVVLQLVLELLRRLLEGGPIVRPGVATALGFTAAPAQPQRRRP